MTTSVSPVRKFFDHTKTTVQTTVKGASVAVTATDAFKKIFQVVKGIIELIGLFVTVEVVAPIVNASKIIGVTVGGFGIVERAAEWIVPDKNGKTLADKPWTKIVSRVYLTFGNLMETLKMLEFFNMFKLVKLDLLAAQMGKVYFFKVIFDHFPGLDSFKNMFVGFATLWSIFDISLAIHQKRKDAKHNKLKEHNWRNLSNRDYERQIEFFQWRCDKYAARINRLAPKAIAKLGEEAAEVLESRGMEASKEKPAKEKKLSKVEARKLKQAQINLPKYENLVAKMSEDEEEQYAPIISDFAVAKAAKWNRKVKNVKIDFAKAGVSLAAETFKLFVVSASLVVSVTLVGWAFLPPVLVVLGLLSNGSGLVKFLVDKLVEGKAPPRVRIPKLSGAV